MRYLWLLPLLLVGCVSDMDLGNGRVLNLAQVEVRSPMGTNDSRSRLRDCLKARDTQNLLRYVYTDCYWVEPDWKQSSSQGQGGQVLGGLFTGAGAAAGGALVQTGGSAINTVVTAPGKGH